MTAEAYRVEPSAAIYLVIIIVIIEPCGNLFVHGMAVTAADAGRPMSET